MAHDEYEGMVQAEGEVWSERAQTYHSQYAPDLRQLIRLNNYWIFAPWFRYLLSQITPGSRVLEIGCGGGWFSLEMARGGAHVVAVDVAEGALDVARRYLEQRKAHENIPGRIDYRLADANTAEFPPSSFDWVVMFGMLHHAPDPALLVRRAAGWLAPNGKLGIMDPLDATRANSLLIGGFMMLLPTHLSYREKWGHLLRLRGQAVGRMTVAVEGRGLSPFEGMGRTAEPRDVVANVLAVERYSEGFGVTEFLSREIAAPRLVARGFLLAIRPLEWALRRLGVIRGLRYMLVARKTA